MIDLITTILAIKSDAQVSIIAEDLNQITWHDDNPTNITKAQILTKQTELKTAYDAKDYQRKRKKEYLSWQQQMEMIYKDQKNGTTTFKDHCDKVRSDNPKG
jgi:hypothetical protein